MPRKKHRNNTKLPQPRFLVMHRREYNEVLKRHELHVYPSPGTVVTSHDGRKYRIMPQGNLVRVAHGEGA